MVAGGKIRVFVHGRAGRMLKAWFRSRAPVIRIFEPGVKGGSQGTLGARLPRGGFFAESKKVILSVIGWLKRRSFVSQESISKAFDLKTVFCNVGVWLPHRVVVGFSYHIYCFFVV